LETGSTATTFEKRYYNTTELALAQRYCAVGLFGIIGSFNNNATDFGYTFPVQMRATPSVAFKSGTTMSYNILGIGAGTLSGISVLVGSSNGMIVRGTGSAGTSGNMLCQTDDNLLFTAEL
jgi:hypothetical protein